MEVALIVLLVVAAITLCFAFIYKGSTAFTAKGLHWSTDVYIKGVLGYSIGLTLIALGAAGLGSGVWKAVDMGYFDVAPSRKPPNTGPVPTVKAKVPDQLPKGAYIDTTLRFYIVPPIDYPWEGGMVSPVVARFKEKLEGEEIENRVAVLRIERQDPMSLDKFIEQELQGIKDNPRYVLYDSGDAEMGATPCKYLHYKGEYTMNYFTYFHMDETHLWMVLTMGDGERHDASLEKLKQACLSFRTYAMAEEEAKANRKR